MSTITIHRLSRANLIAAGSVIVALVSLSALGVVLFRQGQAPVTAAPIPTASISTATVSTASTASSAAAVSPTGVSPVVLSDLEAIAKAQVAAEYAKLNVPIRKAEMPLDKALRLRNALKHEDYAAASQIAAAVLAESKVQGWDFAPFDRVATQFSDLVDPDFARHLDAWVAAYPQDALPLILRGQYHVDLGWSTRGSNIAALVGGDNLRSFDQQQGLAMADVTAAIKLDTGNPYAYSLQLSILHGEGMSHPMVDAFLEAIKHHPAYYTLYSTMLDVLEPKWGGAAENMRGFVDAYAKPAPATSPLKLLYFELYGHFLSMSEEHCSRSVTPPQCVAATMKQLVTPDLEAGLKQALQLYDMADPSPAGHMRFGLAVESTMKSVMRCQCGDFYSGALLQVLATAMHSDTQLTQDQAETTGQKQSAQAQSAPVTPTPTPTPTLGKAAHNDYIIDKLLARSWYEQGDYGKAMAKVQDALADIGATDFASEADRDQALTGIYLRMSETYSRMAQIPAATASAQAANAMGGTNGLEYLACFGFGTLRASAAALEECTAALERNPNNMTTRYYHAQVLDDLGRMDEALKDFLLVAGSNNEMHGAAVMGMTAIYFSRKDNQAALDLLNSHQDLFDRHVTNVNLVARAYDNRCNAYLQLGQLQQALDDCQQSLQYGNLPDAFRKEQELVQKLGQQPKTSL